MASGKPTVSLASVYQQVPEIFLRSVAAGDETQVQLPFEKVLEQFTSCRCAAIRSSITAVPQVETPFLKVTLEDNERFGTDAPVQAPRATGDGRNRRPPSRSPVPSRPTTQEAVTRARRQPAISCPNAHTPAIPRRVRADAQQPIDQSAPTRIPFKLSPNGTGGPPLREFQPQAGRPFRLVAAAPTRIPFKMRRAADDDLRPSQSRPETAVASAEAVAPPKRGSESRRHDLARAQTDSAAHFRRCN